MALFSEPFSVPDDLADGWDDMVRRNRLLQAQNDPAAAGASDPSADLDGGVAPIADFGPAPQTLPMAGPPMADDDDMDAVDWMARRGLQLTGQTPAAGGVDDPVAGPDGAVSGSAAVSLLFPQPLAGGLQPEFGGDAEPASPTLAYRLKGQAPETPTSDNPVAKWAESHVGRDGYGRLEKAPDAGGRNAEFLSPFDQQGRGAPKCNQFVFDALAAGGAPAGRMADGHIPVAKEWGDPGSVIPGYAPVVDGSVHPGDVVSNGDHVAIYAPLADGSAGTVSAASPLTPDAGLLGGVVHNRWGFRGDEGNVVVWRPATAQRQAKP